MGMRLRKLPQQYYLLRAVLRACQRPWKIPACPRRVAHEGQGAHAGGERAGAGSGGRGFQGVRNHMGGSA